MTAATALATLLAVAHVVAQLQTIPDGPFMVAIGWDVVAAVVAVPTVGGAAMLWTSPSGAPGTSAWASPRRWWRVAVVATALAAAYIVWVLVVGRTTVMAGWALLAWPSFAAPGFVTALVGAALAWRDSVPGRRPRARVATALVLVPASIAVSVVVYGAGWGWHPSFMEDGGRDQVSQVFSRAARLDDAEGSDHDRQRSIATPAAPMARAVAGHPGHVVAVDRDGDGLVDELEVDGRTRRWCHDLDADRGSGTVRADPGPCAPGGTRVGG